MAFFINPQSNDGEEGEKSASQEHFARSTPLFKQDPKPSAQWLGGPLSLSAYVSRHLEGDGKGEQTSGFEESAPLGVSSTSSGALEATVSDIVNAPEAPLNLKNQSGQYLNTLDGDFTAGLEQYMPTPLFRLRVTKKRLDSEIADLKGRITKYERLEDKNPAMLERIAAFRSRLAVLEAHDRQVAKELAAMLAMGPFFCAVSFYVKRLWRSPMGFFENLGGVLARWIYGADYVAVAQANAELQNLQDVFADRLKDPFVSQEELGQILNRYDQLYEQAQRQVDGVSHRFRTGWLSGGFVVTGSRSGRIK